MADTADLIRQRFDALAPVLDEQARRCFAAAEARVLGRGGVTLVSKVTGIARSTINRGIVEIEENRSAGEGRVRRPGGGRRAKTRQDPTLLDDLQSLFEASTRGDPMSPLLWTFQKSRQTLRRAERHATRRMPERRRQTAAQTRLLFAIRPTATTMSMPGMVISRVTLGSASAAFAMSRSTPFHLSKAVVFLDVLGNRGAFTMSGCIDKRVSQRPFERQRPDHDLSRCYAAEAQFHAELANITVGAPGDRQGVDGASPLR